MKKKATNLKMRTNGTKQNFEGTLRQWQWQRALVSALQTSLHSDLDSDTALYIVDHLGVDAIMPVNVGVPVAPAVGERPSAPAVPAPVAPSLVGVAVVVDQEAVAAPLLVRPLPLERAAHGAVLLVALARVRPLQRISQSFFKYYIDVSSIYTMGRSSTKHYILHTG